jgi:predicted AlkP superfamily pyrophosphatase or phosphodiesterase
MRRAAALVLAAAWLPVSACGDAAPRQKVLVIGIDGVRADILAEVATPNIDALIADGAFNDQIETKAQTWSGPAWSSMLTGAWPDKHLVTSNDFNGNDYATYPDFLTRLELIDSEINTLAVLDWPPLGTTESGGPLISDAVDRKATFDGETTGYEEADFHSVETAAAYIAEEDPDAAFVYIGNPDVAAHDHGVSPEYRASIEMADAQVGRLLEAVSSRPTYDEEDWLILVSTDHGHKDEGGHGGESAVEKRIFYLASGPAAIRGSRDIDANLVDVAVTAMAHLGVHIDPSWQLDGKVAGLADPR